MALGPGGQYSEKELVANFDPTDEKKRLEYEKKLLERAILRAKFAEELIDVQIRAYNARTPTGQRRAVTADLLGLGISKADFDDHLAEKYRTAGWKTVTCTASSNMIDRLNDTPRVTLSMEE